jgi:hypothetical protein
VMGADIILAQILRGIAANGLMANLHKDKFLSHLIGERLPSISQKQRDKIIACLTLLDTRHRIVRHPISGNGDPETDMDWLKIALESQARNPFQAIFLSEELENGCDEICNSFVDIENALDSDQWLNSQSRTAVVKKTPIEYSKALSPILRHARAIQLIDPFMNYDEGRYFVTLDLISAALGNRDFGKRPGRIYLHAELKHQKPIRLDPADYLNGWVRKLQSLVARDNHRFSVFLWESLPGSEHMHDRYILTDQCGLSIPGGLDCRTHSDANSTDFNIIDEDVRIKHWNEYDPTSSPFNLVGKIDC